MATFMSIDLMFVDDETTITDYLEILTQTLATHYSFPTPNYLKFQSGVEALNYLKANPSNLPTGYIVDMRIPYNQEELDSPLNIYRFLQARDATAHFTFYTGHISEHDLKVQEATNARIIKKTDIPNLKQFILSILSSP
jgi:hypothetical protein